MPLYKGLLESHLLCTSSYSNMGIPGGRRAKKGSLKRKEKWSTHFTRTEKKSVGGLD